jgi:hypothetical protein
MSTIAPVREIVIVIRDLYLEPGAFTRPAAAEALELAPASASRGGASPSSDSRGLERLARLATRTILPEGWRAWIARWLGLPRYAGVPPASVAAAVLASLPPERAVWLATPLHLVAGLTSVHFDRRSVLRPPHAELEALAATFAATFRGSGFELHPLAGGELLLSGPPPAAPVITTEPARVPLTSVAEALPTGAGAPGLRRLGAEIEMWLHDHPLNEARARRGAAPIGTLWVWGGGACGLAAVPPGGEIGAAAFGTDAYVRGLWRLGGSEAGPMPVDWAALTGEPRAQRVLGVVEVADLLHANPSWRLADALAEIDRSLLTPALAALRGGELGRLTLIANDRALTLRPADRWRLWRRQRPGLEGLA